MRLRNLPRRTAALVAASALAAAAACSSPTATQAGSSAAASPSRTTYGTQTPLAGNFEASGLTATTLSFKAETGTVYADEAGVTYIEPRTDASADLTVRRALWDGTEAWSTAVAVPDDVADMHLRLSADPGIGVVSVWFAGPDETSEDEILLRNTEAMANQVTWLELETGRAASEDLATAAFEYAGVSVRSNENFAGAIVMEDDSTTSGVLYVNADLSLTGSSWGELLSAEGDFQLSDVAQWNGTPLFTLTDKQVDTNNIVQLGPAELLIADSDSVRFIPGPTHLGLKHNEDLWLVDETGAVVEVDTSACELGENHQYPTISDTALYAGLARVTLDDHSLECLADLAPTADAKIAGEFSDGSLLLTSTLYGADVQGTWLVPADRSEAVKLDNTFNSTEVHSDYIVQITDGAEVTFVDVYDYRDLTLPQE
ncbi:hypothetical protein GZ998_07325 [Actinomyces sp. 594]|uniref:hypothetical protein n=1 Tax=Actinomyces sp. 594 TaxID=2057793 RepID=UPI001C5A2B23|nr:hypothetical protein [Actinomyces sp. 594]MBW3069309.1 hypothetical protein [Actinomyces sp. 594]